MEMNRTPMTDIMLDLETLSTSPRALIVSIGAVAFDRHSDALGAEFYRKVKLDPSHGDIDGATIEWWMEHAAAWPKGEAAHLTAALISFSDYLVCQTWNNRRLEQGPADVHLWSHGANFDIPILTSAYRTFDTPVPWKHRAPRDTRTLLDIAGLPLCQAEDAVAHHALEDAKAQARMVQRAFAVLAERGLTAAAVT